MNVELESPTRAIMKTLAARMALSLDEIVSSALADRLGNADLQPADMADRLTRDTTPDGRSVWFVDGDPFLETWPIETESDGRMLTATMNHRRIGP